LTFCSTVNLTSSAVSSPHPSWNFTPERSLNVHVRISFEGFHSVASPGRYAANVVESRMMSASYTAVPDGFSAWTVRQANGVSVPHCPTATTRRSLAALALLPVTSGAPMRAVVAAPAA